MNLLYKLKDYRETFQFEKEHPKELRWDDKYKMYMLTQEPNVQGLWLKENGVLIGEILLSWHSDNIVHIDSFTIHPDYRKQGFGYKLVQHALEWAEERGFEFVTGEARKGASWKIFENIGASVMVRYKNYHNTGEEYVLFKIQL